MLKNYDLSLSLSKKEEAKRLQAAQEKLLYLRLVAGGLFDEKQKLGKPLCIVFEGWDASGKGGAIKRLVTPLDPRHYTVHTFAAPTPDEKRHHFLTRFWAALPGWGGMTILDRSWYGRVLVERVEEYATEEQWMRAYEEIRNFEKTITDEGMLLVKFWLHVSDEEQARRFEERQNNPLKNWKLTDEDWRNRSKRTEYETAINDMLEKTDTSYAPWVVVEADDKRYARVKVLEHVNSVLEKTLKAQGFSMPLHSVPLDTV
jgi:AMP-polyphosphate phosphotransferase